MAPPWGRGSSAAGAAAARHALLAACLLCLLASAAASPGDRAVAFRRCKGLCTRTGCGSVLAAAAAAPAGPRRGRRGLRANTTAADIRTQCSPLCRRRRTFNLTDPPSGSRPLALALWRWDCPADCSYVCMWLMERSRPSDAGPVQKYYGKWPFRRWMGMQEPAAVLFSLLNLAAHAHCLARFVRLCRALGKGRQRQAKGRRQERGGGGSGGGEVAARGGGYPYRWLWGGYMALSINAWLWSAVFHSRDTRLTERLDYFSAALLIFFNLFLCLVRTARLRSAAAMLAAAAPLAAFLASHFRFMLLVLFDYAYHVKVCIAAGAAQSALWLGWAAATAPAGRRHLLAFILLVNACMALEVLDFPPLWHALDAHSLWHAATAPLVYLFYQFIVADVAPATATSPSPSPAAKAKHNLQRAAAFINHGR